MIWVSQSRENDTSEKLFADRLSMKIEYGAINTR